MTHSLTSLRVHEKSKKHVERNWKRKTKLDGALFRTTIRPISQKKTEKKISGRQCQQKQADFRTFYKRLQNVISI